MSKVELGDGQWVEMKERLTHGEDKVLRKAMARSDRDFDNDDEAVELNTIALGVFIRDWYVKDLDGNWLTTHDIADIEKLPSDVADILVIESTRLYRELKGINQTYAGLIGRLILGQAVTEAEIDNLPDPDLFRDALFLARNGKWTPEDLDGADSMLIRLVRHLQKVPA